MDSTSYILSLILFAASVYVYGLRLLQRFKYRRFPGPQPSWLIGGVKTFRAKGQHIAYKEWAANYGPGFHVLHLAGQPFLGIGDPDAARKVLYGGARPNMARNSILPPHVRRQTQYSILLTRGKTWRDLRAAWQPMFFTGSLEGYMGIMDNSAKLLVAEMAAANGALDLQPAIQDMTLSVVGQSAFGIDLHSQKADKAEISEAERKRSNDLRTALKKFFLSPSTSPWVLAASVFPFLVPVIRALSSWFPDKTLARMIDSRAEVEGVVAGLIKEHQDKVSSSQESQKGPHSPEIHAFANGAAEKSKSFFTGLRRGVAPGSFIDLLITKGNSETGEPFSTECIAQQALTMLLAGYETTANALTFTTYLLARSCNAEQQAKLVREVDQLGRAWEPSFEDLDKKLPYMDAVINESLRVLPPAFITVRETETPLEIKGQTLDKGSWVVVSPYVIQNDSRVWGQDAAEFRPERWLTHDPEEQKRNRKGFFAFGHGPRVCPGSRFAILEIKLALVRIFQSFTLQLEPGQEPLAIRDSITISAKKGVIIRPLPR